MRAGFATETRQKARSYFRAARSFLCNSLSVFGVFFFLDLTWFWSPTPRLSGLDWLVAFRLGSGVDPDVVNITMLNRVEVWCSEK